MSLSDCIKCWNTPCTCGWEYRFYSFTVITKYIASTLRYRTKEEAIKVLESAIEMIKERDENFEEWENNKLT
jgi:hypothetical protein